MRSINRICCVLLAAGLGLTAALPARADVDKDKNKRSSSTRSAAKSLAAGNCNLGTATKDLDINNVRARVYNNGGLFWKGAGNVYNVPKAAEGQPITPNALFAGGIWIGGRVGSENRAAAADYGNWEFWPGPLDANGNPPGDCSQYDRIFKVSKEDMIQADAGNISPDMNDWPWDLGAPVRDGDGNPDNYNLAGGDRPDLLGDQMAWWIMNDAGNVHQSTGTNPIGLEVQVTAFSFNTAGDLGNTTFYKYRLLYKGQQPVTDSWFGIWSDPDLGNAVDDYVGSDTTLGLGFVYNSDNNDEGSDGYGTPPPALGYDFFQGPLVTGDGLDNDGDGEVDEENERLKMTRFLYYDNVTAPNGNPRSNTDDWYNYLRGIWQDGTPMQFGGDGYDPGGQNPTHFMWPGDPVTAQYWSEMNIDGNGVPSVPNDRRFLMSTGPFTMNPGDVQEIVYGIVTGFGADNLDSVTKMREADALAQQAYDIGFRLPSPPDAPLVSVTEMDNSVILTWTNAQTSNNYLERYSEVNPLLGEDVEDRTYDFEGYKVWQYPTNDFQNGKVIATFDVKNGITRVIEGQGLTYITADGADTGVQHHIRFDNLNNFQQYYYAVSAYAYNEFSSPKVYDGPARRVVATPSSIDARNGGTVVQDQAFEQTLDVTHASGAGEGVVAVRVINPGQVTGHDYGVKFYDVTIPDPEDPTHEITFATFDIIDNTTGEVKVNGRTFATATGEPLPQEEGRFFVVDGLEFQVTGPQPGLRDFLIVANANGPLTGAALEYGAFAFNSSGFPTQAETVGHDRPTPDAQATHDAVFGIHTADTDPPSRLSYSSFFSRTTRDGGNLPFIGSSDYEWRFTGTSIANRAFQDGAFMEVPFELWDIGRTPDNPADDVRLIPLVLDDDENGVFSINAVDSLKTSSGFDHAISGGGNDPYSDWVYWYRPADMSPGQAGYQAYAALAANNDLAALDLAHDEVFARFVLVGFNLGTSPLPEGTPLVPEQGTIYRIVTAKPSGPGDEFVVSTAGLGVQTGVDSVAAASLDDIGITPNPYKGASAYEVSNLLDVARFTNLPQQATIRVFTLSGTLVRTLIKSGPEAYLDWDLKSEEGLPIASGMYLIHVEVPELGEKVLKFGVIKKRVQLDLL